MLSRVNPLALLLCVVLMVLGLDGVVGHETIGLALGGGASNFYSLYGRVAIIFGAAYLLAAVAVLVGWGFPKLTSRYVWITPFREVLFFLAAVCFFLGALESVREYLFPSLRPL